MNFFKRKLFNSCLITDKTLQLPPSAEQCACRGAWHEGATTTTTGNNSSRCSYWQVPQATSTLGSECCSLREGKKSNRLVVLAPFWGTSNYFITSALWTVHALRGGGTSHQPGGRVPISSRGLQSGLVQPDDNLSEYATISATKTSGSLRRGPRFASPSVLLQYQPTTMLSTNRIRSNCASCYQR